MPRFGSMLRKLGLSISNRTAVITTAVSTQIHIIMDLRATTRVKNAGVFVILTAQPTKQSRRSKWLRTRMKS